MASHAEIIARHLAGAGCKHAFGMPGGEVLVLLEALRAEGIAFHLVKHENAGGFMAEGAWHATGAPGILLTTVGPGLANAVNAVANAFQEQVPMIVLSGCIDAGEAAQFTHQVIDQQALMAPITKASIRVAPGAAAQAVGKALSLALSDPMGPVHLDLPVGIAGTEAPDAAVDRHVVETQRIKRGRAAREDGVQHDLRFRRLASNDLEDALDARGDFVRILLSVPRVVGADHQHDDFGLLVLEPAVVRESPDDVLGTVAADP